MPRCPSFFLFTECVACFKHFVCKSSLFLPTFLTHFSTTDNLYFSHSDIVLVGLNAIRICVPLTILVIIPDCWVDIFLIIVVPFL